MAKSAKSSKPARAPEGPGMALKTVAVRVGAAVALIGVAAGAFMLHERRAEAPPPQAAAVAPKAAPAAPSPVATTAAVEETPEPPRRAAEASKPMSAALRAAFDTWLMGTYAKCWRAPKAAPDGDPYFPKVRVAFKEDGELASPPKLVNPPSDPAWKPHAEAALKAVKGCDPLHVPDKYAAYYPAWKSKTVYFDPMRN